MPDRVASHRPQPLPVPWNVRDCASSVTAWHMHWSRTFGEFVSGLDVQWRPPEAVLTLDVTKASGTYSGLHNTCTYRIAYAATYGPDFESTVWHEVAHAAQKQLMPKSQWHGDFFKFLMRRVARDPAAATYHNYDVTLVRRVAVLLLATTPDVDAALEAGTQHAIDRWEGRR